MCKSDAMKSGFLKSRNGPLSTSVYVNSGRNSMDDLFNANVEALASQEETIYPDGYVTCFRSTYDDGSLGYYLRVRECLNCTIVDATSASGSSKCMQ